MIGGIGEYWLKLQWGNNSTNIAVTNMFLRVYAKCSGDNSVGDYKEVCLRVSENRQIKLKYKYLHFQVAYTCIITTNY